MVLIRMSNTRSRNWFQGPEYYAFARRAWLRSEGFDRNIFDGKPVIGICNSWSELNNCNVHLRQVAEAVKRGVWAAGGVPLEFPTISLGEMLMKPTAMLFRNLMAMDVEESIRANPLDGVVLLCGCDKTTPAQLMGAASADIPSIMVPGGPMLAGNWRDRKLGSGTDGRKLFDMFRSGRLSEEQWCEVEGAIARTSRALHGDGHGVHHDQPGRGARHDAARLRQHSRARFAPHGHRRGERPPHRRNGGGRSRGRRAS